MGPEAIMIETQTQADPSTSSEELAYLLLEEARLRCKSLLAAEHGHHEYPDSLTLTGLYGDLGIAGYYASARLEPRRRRQLLAQARARSGMLSAASDDSEDAVRALAEVTAAATRTVERALTITGLLDHVHLAHLHVMAACETLDAMYAVPT